MEGHLLLLIGLWHWGLALDFRRLHVLGLIRSNALEFGGSGPVSWRWGALHLVVIVFGVGPNRQNCEWLILVFVGTGAGKGDLVDDPALD